MQIKRNSIVIVLLLLINSYFVHCQNIELFIYDKETYEGIPFVQVSNSNIVLNCDENGELTIPKSKEYTFRHFEYNSISLRIEELEKLNYKVGLYTNSNTMDEVVLSASKFEEKKKDVAQKIQVIRSNEIRHMNQTSMADVLSNSGNVFVQKSQLGGGSPVIRGFETNKVLLVVDGIRMNNAIYRGGHLQNVITLDNSIMDRVEVLYGSGSVIYGSDAIGGVMSFNTKNPLLSKDSNILVKGNAYMRYFSAANGYATNANVSIGKNKIGSLTSISFSNYGDLRQGRNRSSFVGNFGSRPWFVDRIDGQDSVRVNLDSNLQVGSGYAQIDFLQKFIFKPNENFEHSLNFQLSNSSNINRYDRLSQISGDFPKFAEWYYGPQFRLLSSYSLNCLKSTQFYDRARLTMGYQKVQESRMDRRFKSDILNHRIENVDVFTLNLDLYKKLEKHELRFGSDVFYNYVESRAYTKDIVSGVIGSLDTRYPDAGSDMYSMALFATHTYEANKKIILNDGLRINYVGLNANFNDQTYFPFPFNRISQDNIALNGNFGLIFLPNESLRISSNISSGFRAPNVDDLTKVFESVPGRVVVPNPSLRAENSYTTDIGLVFKLSKDVSITSNAYFTLLTNALTLQPGLFNGMDSVFYDGEYSQVLTTKNSDRAFVTGVETMISGQLNEFFSIFGSYNYTYGRITMNDNSIFEMDSLLPLGHIPPVFGKFGLNYQKEKFRVELFLNYAGWKYIKDYSISGEDNEAFALPEGMPGWYTINTRLNYIFNAKISMQIACENMLDKNYRNFASNISAPGRNFIITLRGSF